MSQFLNGFDVLEDRVLLAGNVTVAFNAAGDLVVTGDNQANDISIVDVDGDGHYSVVGNNDTTVTYSDDVIQSGLFDIDANGVSTDDDVNVFNAPVASAGDNLIVNLKGGDDTLTFVDSGVAGDLGVGLDVAINMGTGNDFVDIMGAGETSFDHVSINLGVGQNGLLIDTTTANVLKVVGGAGNDNIDISNFNANSLSIAGGAGVDNIGVSSSFVADANVNGGAGADNIGVTNSNITNMSISGGAGGDIIGASGSVFGDLSISGNKGRDQVNLDTIFVTGDTSVIMDGGKDLVDIQNSVFDGSFSLKGGKGSDEVSVGNSDFNGVVFFNGGKGSDFLYDNGGNNIVFNSSNTKSFTIIT